MEHQRRDRHDHAGGGADQGLAAATGQLVHVTHAVVEDAQEHLDHADHRAEQAQQRARRGDGAQCVEETFHAVHQVAAGVLDALADLVTRAIARFQRGGQQRAQRRVGTQGLQMGRITLAARGPVAHFLAEAGRQHFRPPQGPETLQDDRQSQYAQQHQRHHRPAAGLDQFPHVSTLRPNGRLYNRR
ncbi:hypothetical protein G6F46_013734 [Rhizopus delemar]|nr:hypothetical protein G6F46_013734 [Rhizopus delemar]